MASKNQLIFDILNTAYGGEQSDDAKVSERQVGFWVDQIRALFIEQKAKRGGELPEALVQYLECVNMELHEEIDGCKILRSTVQLPATIGGNHENWITSVYAGEGQDAVFFSRISHRRYKTSKYNKFTSHARRWFIKDGYLYVLNDETTQVLSVSGIFENPSEVAEFCSDGGTCYTDDDKYPVTMSMANNIASMILKDRLGIVRQVEPDETNNAQQTQRTDNV